MATNNPQTTPVNEQPVDETLADETSTTDETGGKSSKAADAPDARQRAKRERRMGEHLADYLKRQREAIEKELVDNGVSNGLG